MVWYIDTSYLGIWTLQQELCSIGFAETSSTMRQCKVSEVRNKTEPGSNVAPLRVVYLNP